MKTIINETIKRLMGCFYGSYLNHNFEFICNKKINSYFRLEDVETEIELKCKVLEWLSRPAIKAQQYRQEKRNEDIRQFHLDGINKFLGTNFTRDDIEIIYTYLGNSINRPLCEKFINSGYDMKVLEDLKK